MAKSIAHAYKTNKGIIEPTSLLVGSDLFQQRLKCFTEALAVVGFQGFQLLLTPSQLQDRRCAFALNLLAAFFGYSHHVDGGIYSALWIRNQANNLDR